MARIRSGWVESLSHLGSFGQIFRAAGLVEGKDVAFERLVIEFASEGSIWLRLFELFSEMCVGLASAVVWPAAVFGRVHFFAFYALAVLYPLWSEIEKEAQRAPLDVEASI